MGATCYGRMFWRTDRLSILSAMIVSNRHPPTSRSLSGQMSPLDPCHLGDASVPGRAAFAVMRLGLDGTRLSRYELPGMELACVDPDD